jgi:NADH:ubiquinone oxidoreductase subunit 6 (subunit J)
MTALAAIALLTLAAAASALALRDLIHSALLLIASWVGIAAFYLWAGAEFVAFAQVLIYVGAISMVVLFAVLLTRPPTGPATGQPSSRAVPGFLAGGAVLGLLAGAVLSSPLPAGTGAAPAFGVRELGLKLLGPHAGALLATGALLTVALLGAVVLAAARDKEDAS